MSTHFPVNPYTLWRPTNPSIWWWHILIQEFQFPFIKRELFSNQQLETALTQSSWREQILSQTQYIPEYISSHYPTYVEGLTTLQHQ